MFDQKFKRRQLLGFQRYSGGGPLCPTYRQPNIASGLPVRFEDRDLIIADKTPS